jgi:hypothetical protein
MIIQLCYIESFDNLVSWMQEQKWMLVWWNELGLNTGRTLDCRPVFYSICKDDSTPCSLFKDRKQDFRSFQFSLFFLELSEAISSPKTQSLTLRSGRRKGLRQNFAPGILNHGRVQFRFLCLVQFYQRATLWSPLWLKLSNSESFKCHLWNALALLGKLGQA